MKRFLLFFIFSVVVYNVYPEPYTEYLDTAEIYFEQGRYHEAYQSANAAREINPNSARAHLILGVASIRLGNRDESVNYLYRVIELDNTHAHAYSGLGRFYFDMGNLEKALVKFNLAIYHAPEVHQQYALRGILHAAMQNFGNAFADFNKAIELSPNNTDNFHNRGRLFMQLGQYENALQDFDEAIRLNSEQAVSFFLRGVLHARLRQYNEALADYSRAIQLDGNNYDAHNGRGAAYFNTGRYYEALEDFNSAIRINPNSRTAHLFRGAVYQRLAEMTTNVTRRIVYSHRASDDFETASRLEN